MNYFQYPVISGVWTSSFALGNFLGPTFGGLLYASVGFGYTTMAFQERIHHYVNQSDVPLGEQRFEFPARHWH